MLDLDASHATVHALKSLVPGLVVAGGSFSTWLPHPQTLPPASRMGTFNSARSAAELLCLKYLFQRAGLKEDVGASTGEGGDRKWPSGFVGSITHKGAVVLAVIAKSSTIEMIGIDLERTEDADLRPVSAIVAPEGLPGGIDSDLGLLYAFSAKEAVFKAQYPLCQRRLGFDDVALVWEASDKRGFKATIRGDLPRLLISGRRVGRWLVSAAFSIKRSDF